MRIASLIARYLAGVIFLIMGLNGFLNFIPLPPPGGVAGQFMGALYVSHYLWVIFAFQVIGGLLLLVNRYIPLAVAILAPVIVNILTFHVLMAPSGLPVALLVAILWTAIFIEVRAAFSGLFQSRWQPRGLTAEERDKTCHKINSRSSSQELRVNKAARWRTACLREGIKYAPSLASRTQSRQSCWRTPARRSLRLRLKIPFRSPVRSKELPLSSR
jgi:putative oxidoreductase